MAKDGKTVLRKSNAIVFSKSGFSATQMDILNRCIATQQTSVEDIELDRLYTVEFNRSDIPKVESVAYLKKQLLGLHKMQIKNMIEGAEWSSVTPFPELAEYKGGRISLVMAGRFLKAVKEKTNGYSINLLMESFGLNGGPAKILFDMFGSYKNRETTRFEEDAEILQDLLGAAKSYRRQKQQYYDETVLPALKQINEKTSITVKGKYTRTTRNRKGFYTFDVYRDGQEAPKTKQALPKGKKPKKVLPDDFILPMVDEAFLPMTFPTAVYSPEAYQSYQKASASSELKQWRKNHTRIKNFLPVNAIAGVKWYVIPYSEKEYSELK